MNKQSEKEPPASGTERQTPGQNARPVRQADFWVSILVLAFVVDFFITVAAVCYGIIVTPPRPGGEAVRLAFPWMGWLAAMLAAPAVLIGLARMMAPPGEGGGSEENRRDEAWASRLPAKALRLYHVVRDAPLFVICLALLLLGATLITVDSAFSLVSGIALALVPYLPYFIGAFTVLAVAVAGFAAYFRHKNNRLAAEYAFRREVLQKTGVILVDPRHSVLLPPGSAEGYRIGRIAGKDEDGPVVETTPLKALPKAEPQEPREPERPEPPKDF